MTAKMMPLIGVKRIVFVLKLLHILCLQSTVNLKHCSVHALMVFPANK